MMLIGADNTLESQVAITALKQRLWETFMSCTL